MAVINIRHRDAKLGNISNYRALDVSSMANDPVAQSVQNTLKSVGDAADWYVRMQEKKDNLVVGDAFVKADAQIQQALYDAKDGVLAKFERGEKDALNYTSDPNEVLSKIRQSAEKSAGFDKLSGNQRKLFVRDMDRAMISVRKLLDQNANKFVTAKEQATAKAMLNITKRNYLADPSEANLEALNGAFDASCKAHNMTNAQRNLASMEMTEKLLSDVAGENIARCQTLDQLKVVRASLEHYKNGTEYGLRHNSEQEKHSGWLGVLKAANGETVTEYSVGIHHADANGQMREVEIPLVVPTLTEEEVDFLLKTYIPADKTKQKELQQSDEYKVILGKAVEHAAPLLDEGKSPFYEGAFGNLGPWATHLPQTERKKILDAAQAEIKKREDQIKRENAAALESQIEEVDAVKSRYLEGNVTAEELVATRDSMKDKGYSADAMIKMSTLINTAQKKEDNASVDAFKVAVIRTNPSEAMLDTMVEGLPSHLRNSLDVVSFVSSAKAGTAKAAWESEQERRKIRLDQAVYNKGAYPMTVDERVEAVTEMFSLGLVTGDQYDAAIQKIKVEHDKRTKDIAARALQLAEGAYWGLDKVVKFDDNGYNMSATRSAFSSVNLFIGKNNLAADTTAKAFDEHYTAWCNAVAENPSWSTKECEEAFFVIMKPVLDVFVDESFKFNEKEWKNSRAILDSVRALNSISKDRKHFDYSPSAIGGTPTNAEFRPVR